MLSHTKYLSVKVPGRMDFVNITGEVEKAVKDSRVREGLCLVNAMHITASVFINDDEPGLHEDYKRWLEGWRRTTRVPSAIITIAPARTTATRITSAR
jgi:thiamine phosphate synthase YjbQ (UPF0047 family)